MLKILLELELFADNIRITPVNSHRSISLEELKDLANRFPRVKVAESIANAFNEAYCKMNKNSVLCIIGSHYIAEEVYDLQEIRNKHRETKPIISTGSR